MRKQHWRKWWFSLASPLCFVDFVELQRPLFQVSSGFGGSHLVLVIAQPIPYIYTSKTEKCQKSRQMVIFVGPPIQFHANFQLWAVITRVRCGVAASQTIIWVAQGPLYKKVFKSKKWPGGPIWGRICAPRGGGGLKILKILNFSNWVWNSQNLTFPWARGSKNCVFGFFDGSDNFPPFMRNFHFWVKNGPFGPFDPGGGA